MTPRTASCANQCGNETASELKCCSGCKQVVYCSKACQTADWRRHIFDCKPDRPIGTAYYLSRACADSVLPLHPQTRKDFGFDKAELALCGCAQRGLLALWTKVFDVFGVSEKELQRWQVEGKLVEHIMDGFLRFPPDRPEPAYEWFTEHYALLDGSPIDQAQAYESASRSYDDATRRAWVMTGGSPYDTLATIKRKIRARPSHVRACHVLYTLLWWETHPKPQYASWLTFGFVAAMNQADAQRIAEGYKELIQHVEFDDFSFVHRICHIAQLAELHGIAMAGEAGTPAAAFFCDVMSESPYHYKTVWHLKQYVDQLRYPASPGSAPPSRLDSAVRADYGFANCQNRAERKLLDNLYVKYFAHRDANPLDLHKACQDGLLAEYIGGFVRMKPKATYMRLLKNAYPESPGGDSQGSTADGSKALVPMR